MLNFAAAERSSLIDYPGLICCTVFLSGCNFRCPFCYNIDLMEFDDSGLSENKIIGLLKKRRGLLDGLCVTGGEPTLHTEGLISFLSRVKKLGFSIKLDTNGSRPDVVKNLIDRNLLDYLALDIKDMPANYSKTCGKDIDIEKIEETILIIREYSCAIEYEFRTTAIPGFHDSHSFMEIKKWLVGLSVRNKNISNQEKESYYIQQFSSEDVLDPDLRDQKGFSQQKLKSLASILKDDFITSIRGI